MFVGSLPPFPLNKERRRFFLLCLSFWQCLSHSMVQPFPVGIRQIAEFARCNPVILLENLEKVFIVWKADLLRNLIDPQVGSAQQFC